MTSFVLPPFCPPDFTVSPLSDAPEVVFRRVEKAGVAPEDYHATSIYPEYFHIDRGEWVLPRDSRMDSVVV
ncbi:MAG: hypothetical protein LLG06_16875, partial [Desulfobacteraceae bacterium]|nr:hypothetical protein [Desulfobacteraceae bacterium]